MINTYVEYKAALDRVTSLLENDNGGPGEEIQLLINQIQEYEDKALTDLTAEEWNQGRVQSSSVDGIEVIPVRQDEFIGGFTYFEQ